MSLGRFSKTRLAMAPLPVRPWEEIEQMRRSIALLTPGSMAMRREDALQLLGKLGDVQRRLDRLREGLRALLGEEG